MIEATVCLAHEVPSAELRKFLKRSFGAVKAEFLSRHGTWWHRGEDNRWALVVGGDIAGYCGVIPTHCAIDGRPHPALWWVDLVIAPEFRGKGLQTRFDELVRDRGALLLGFPNELAATIHRRHGWGVRDDLRTLLMPLAPHRLRAVQRAAGARGRVLRLAAQGVRPIGWFLHARLRAYRPKTSYRLHDPDFSALSGLALDSLVPEMVTTWRDAEYLRWRYGAGPQEILIYGAGGVPGRPQIVLIARRLGHEDSRAERWLDVFGELGNREILQDLILFAAREAAVANVAQISVLAAAPAFAALLRRCGFLLSSKARFCWLGGDREMGRIDALTHHWCFGDSDHDEPDESP